MSAQVWRVLASDQMRDVTVAPERTTGFVASTAGTDTRARASTAHYAVVRLAARLGWEAAEIRGPGEATTAEQLAAVLSGVVDIADSVEDEAHQQRARAVERPGRQLIELAHPEGQALAANKIACAVRGMLAGQGEAAEAYVAPLREQFAAATARAEAAEQECARLRAALREYAPRCYRPDADGNPCCRCAAYGSGSDERCEAHAEGSGLRALPHADVLRSLDGVTR